MPDETPLLNGFMESQVNIWVGGLYGTLLHWNGSEWSDHSQDVQTVEIFVRDEEVVAVGGESKWGGTQGFVWKLMAPNGQA